MPGKTISAHGIALLEAREGVRLTGYKDSKGIPTIGVGHVILPGEPYAVGKKITQAECDALFEEDLRPCESAVNSAVKVPVTQNQFDAMVSFAFNIGTGGFRTSSVVKCLNAGNIEGAAGAFMNWVKPPEIRGRRRSEQKQFLTPYAPVGPTPIPIHGPDPPVVDPVVDKPDKPPPDPQVVTKERVGFWTKIWTGICAFFSLLWGTVTSWYASDFAKPLFNQARDTAVDHFSLHFLALLGIVVLFMVVIGGVSLCFLWLGLWIWNREKKLVAALNEKKIDTASDPKKATVEFTDDPAKSTANIQAVASAKALKESEDVVN